MVRNKVVINGEEKLIRELTETERNRLKESWNRTAAETVNYIEQKTA